MLSPLYHAQWITGISDHAWCFMWLLWIWTDVHILCQQALLLTEPSLQTLYNIQKLKRILQTRQSCPDDGIEQGTDTGQQTQGHEEAQVRAAGKLAHHNKVFLKICKEDLNSSHKPCDQGVGITRQSAVHCRKTHSSKSSSHWVPGGAEHWEEDCSLCGRVPLDSFFSRNTN